MSSPGRMSPSSDSATAGGAATFAGSAAGTAVGVACGPLSGAEDGAETAVARATEGGEVARVFGRERTGLDNDELQLCHAAVHIPANPEYSSLNLAAAVQVLTYEVRLALLEGAVAEAPAQAHPDEVPASHAHMEGFFSQLGDTLDAIDFHKGRTPDSAMRKLRRLFAKAQLNEQEVRLLRGILADAQRMARLAGGGGTGSLS